MKRGFSVVEVVLAAGIFAVFISGAVMALISGWYGNRQGADTAMAVEYAGEGMEALRSLRNRGYANLTETAAAGIVRDASGVWVLSGTNNTTDSGRITRVIKVESVNRDVSGNIVPAPTGTMDTNTKKVTSKVNWNLTAARPQEIILSSYLTNWKAPIGASGGLLVYGDATIIPKYRSFDQAGNIFSDEASGPAGTAGKTFVIKTSPTKHEAIAGYTDAVGNLKVLCFDGTNWSVEWETAVGVTGTGTTRRFDIGYETASGDVLVVYSTNAGTNELAYRTKLGSTGCGSANWAAPVSFDSPITTGVVQWVKMASDRRGSSNIIAAVWADANSDLQAGMWNGSGWVQRGAALETSLEVTVATATYQDVDDFDVDFESVSGDVMVVWAISTGLDGANGVRFATCNGGTATCSWSVKQTPPTWFDDATNLDISANPLDDQIIFASIGNAGSDLQVGRWDGGAWVNTDNLDRQSGTPTAGTEMVATGWLVNGSTVRGVVVYNDQQNPTAVNYQVMTPGSPPSWLKTTGVFAPAPALVSPKKWSSIQMDPINREYLMLSITDVSGGNRLFAKRLVMSATGVMTWTNADGGVALGTVMGQATTSPFSFGYWIK